ncbi:hypothetical protein CHINAEXTREME_04275 [Halobiforma lacisalsi AJ5]|uniref:DUF4013 domain-containing protein n=1 Tax=Natronobacterium lacisalsi AJ5 TaxID=358396 RepID=M0LNR6_NATLA|nr:hypothetical protein CHINAEXTREME_04275 [Halobiforma lacisalsi AJ5]EMA34753.1 hypothetical protein C445_07525 [Halobiforma lacisalsi AJ5]
MLDADGVRRTIAEAGNRVSINFEFRFPDPFLDLWSFVDPPAPTAASSTGGSVPFAPAPVDPPTATGAGDVTVDLAFQSRSVPLGEAGPGLIAGLLALLVAYAAVFSVVYAVYVGGIDRRLRGEPIAVVDCVRSYAGRFLAYFAILFGVFLLAVPILAVAPVLILLALPVALLAMYLFYGVPFLFVVADLPVLEAFRRSYRLALEGGPYLRFGAWYFVVTLIASPIVSVVVSAGGPVGFLLGLTLVVPLSVLLTAATVSFFDEFVGQSSGAGVETGVDGGAAPHGGGSNDWTD